VLLNGQRIDGKTPYEINRLGLARSFQITNVPKLSVFENLRCGVLWSLGYRYTFCASLGPARRQRARRELLRMSACGQARRAGHQPDLRRAARAGDRHHHRRRRPGDPAGAHGRHEHQRDHALHQLIREVTEGKTLLTVEHDMGVVFGLADKIAVVYGEVIAFDTPERVRANARAGGLSGLPVADAQGGAH
jgi:branched-chain amino acid transport system ATP-binding protein